MQSSPSSSSSVSQRKQAYAARTLLETENNRPKWIVSCHVDSMLKEHLLNMMKTFQSFNTEKQGIQHGNCIPISRSSQNCSLKVARCFIFVMMKFPHQFSIERHDFTITRISKYGAHEKILCCSEVSLGL